MDFISQFSTDIKHVAGSDNVVVDTLSRIQEINVDSPIDFMALAVDQTTDTELQSLRDNSNCSLKLQPLKLTPDLYILCDTSENKIRPYVTPKFRQQIFNSLHNLSHPGVRATKKLILSRFVWPSIAKDITLWSRTCVQCQRSKVSRHTTSPIQPFPSVMKRFDHVHIDLVGPLPPSNGANYLLTCIDRFSRWPEAIPLSDISSQTVARIFIEHWVARFGVPTVITTDQGRQFQSALFSSLTALLGVKHIRTTPYHPASNGLVERFHRSLKQSLKCHNNHRWTESLPLVLLGLRSAFKTDLQCTAAELVYGTPLRLPGEFLAPTTTTEVEPSDFLNHLRDTMQKLSPTPTSFHGKAHSFVHPALETCTHVFLRRDGVRKPLQAPFDGPYTVLSRTAKHFTISMQNRTSTVSIDRLKPAFLLADECSSSATPANPNADPVKTPHQTTSSTPDADSPTFDVSANLPVEVPSSVPESSTRPSTRPEPTITRSGRRVRFNPKYF